jgi:hypothetical protein
MAVTGSTTQADKWTIGQLKRGFVLVKWHGATWPRHGVPCGTHWLVNACFKIFDSVRFEPMTLVWENGLAGLG